MRNFQKNEILPIRLAAFTGVMLLCVPTYSYAQDSEYSRMLDAQQERRKTMDMKMATWLANDEQWARDQESMRVYAEGKAAQATYKAKMAQHEKELERAEAEMARHREELRKAEAKRKAYEQEMAEYRRKYGDKR